MGSALIFLLAALAAEEERPPFDADLVRLAHLAEMLAADGADGLLERQLLLGRGQLLDRGDLVRRELGGGRLALAGLGLRTLDLRRILGLLRARLAAWAAPAASPWKRLPWWLGLGRRAARPAWSGAGDGLGRGRVAIGGSPRLRRCIPPRRRASRPPRRILRIRFIACLSSRLGPIDPDRHGANAQRRGIERHSNPAAARRRQGGGGLADGRPDAAQDDAGGDAGCTSSGMPL